MRFSVNDNFVETESKLYKFSTSEQAEDFINCLMTENDVYCSLLVRPAKVFNKPSVPFFAHRSWITTLTHSFSRRLSLRVKRRVQ